MTRMERRQGAKRIAGTTMAAVILALVGAATPARAAAPFIPVNTTTSNADVNGDGRCTLVEAVKALNNAAAYHECPGGTAFNVITLPSGTITSNVVVSITRATATIQGNGLTASAIAFGANNSTGCAIRSSTLSTASLILRNVTVQQNSGLSLTGVCGRGSRITLNGVRVQNFQNSGVIMSAGVLADQAVSPFLANENIIIANNHTFQSGGGVAIQPGAEMRIAKISFVNNFADGSGGGLWMSGNSNSSISNCTFSGNQASLGGGLYSVPTDYLELSHCTFAANNAFTAGGGIHTDDSRGATIHINGSILVSNTAPAGEGANFAGPPTNAGTSQFTLYGGPFDTRMDGLSFIQGDQTLQQADIGGESTGLSNSGAPFFLPIYPLRSTAFSTNTSNCFEPTDERGVARPQGPACDKGAYER